ncbi:helix-turn-helix domain-containing protein [Acinetobacter sp. ANC 4635]|uniref:DNA-binding protein n=1 Tax=Acinetobacter sp. ANC 4635 TaxID=2529846 RepID=UPI003A4C777E
MIKTKEQVRKEFEQSRMTLSEWSLRHNFSRDLVYRILNTNRLPTRGESKRIAIALGLILEEKEE